MEGDPTLDRFAAHDRHLRSVARSLLFDEHRVEDVVQETWLSTIGRSPRSGARLRAWLSGVVRNLAKKTLATERALDARAKAAARPEATPSADDLAALEEARHRIAQAVIALAEPYRTALWLRFFEDLPPRKIGKRLGVPAETARTWVKRGLEQVRGNLDQRYAGRREWCLALLPLAAAAPSLGFGAAATAASKTTFSSIAMASTQTKVGIAAAALAAFTAAFWAVSKMGERDSHVSDSSTARAEGIATAPRRGSGDVAAVETASGSAATRAATPESRSSPAEANTNDPFGTLVVHFRWGEDGTAAAGIGVRLLPRALDNSNFAGPSTRTDSEGTVRFERIPPGSAWVRVDRWFGESVEVKRGEITEITKNLPGGYTIAVSVVNAAGAPVEGAEVFLNEQGMSEWSVGRTDKDGKLSIRSVMDQMFYMVGARTAGYAPTPQIHVLGKKGGNIPVKLKHPGPGGGVEGRIVDRDGKPIPGVALQVGEIDRQQFSVDGGYGQAANASRATSDASGKFQVAGRPPGRNPVVARIVGFGPWRGSVEIPSAGMASVEIVLAEGVTLLGSVQDADGKPVKRAAVQIGEWGSIEEFSTRAADDGSYAVRDLPAEELTARFERDGAGKASFRFRGNPGETIRYDAVLSLGLKIAGRVVDENGNPVKDVNVQASPMEGKAGDADSGGFELSDAQGRFSIANCRDVPHRMWVMYGVTGESKQIENVRPGREELVITVAATPKSDCWIIGTVVDSQRKPAASARLSPYRMGSSFSTIELTDQNGAFKIGPIPPGFYTMTVYATGFAERRTPRHELRPGDTWDLGTLEVQPGARFAVRCHFAEGAPADARPWFQLIDEAGLGAGGGFVPDEKDPKGTLHLRGSVVPGSYLLQVQGASFAATQLPVTVAADRENLVDVELARGVEQRFLFGKPKNIGSGASPPRFTVRTAAGAAVHVSDLWNAADRPAYEVKLGLAPGDYTYQVSTPAGIAASGSFKVGDAPGEAVTAPLR